MKKIILNITILLGIILISLNLFGNIRALNFQVSDILAKTITVKKDPLLNSKLDTARKVNYLNDLEKNVVLELNKVRTNPREYALKQLTDFRKLYKGNIIRLPNGLNIITNEGVKAVDECINVLKNTKPMSILKPSKGLSLAAKDLVKDQTNTKNTGHIAKDGSTPSIRMNRYGKWLEMSAENIEYGSDKADIIVISLLVDDGVPSRGHRINILNKNLNVIGVASGTHQMYRNMFVMDFAKGYKEK